MFIPTMTSVQDKQEMHKIVTHEQFAKELLMLRGVFDAADDASDWELARGAFETLKQTAWGLYALASADDFGPVPAPRPEVYFTKVD